MQPRLFTPRSSTIAALTLFCTTVAVLLTLVRLDAEPRLLPPRWEGPSGALPTGHPEAEAALLLDPARIRAASRGRFSQRDFSAGWWNWLTQEVGPASVLTPEMLSTERLARLRLLVVSRSAAASLPPSLNPALQDLVTRGGAVVLELPTDGWEDLTGVSLSGPEQVGGRLTRVDIAPGIDFNLFELRTRHRIAQPGPPAGPAAQPHVWIDGQPVIFSRPLGEGLVITAAVDLGQLWQTLQQGRPDEDLQVRNRYPDVQSLPLETSDLVVDRALLQAEQPFADLLEDGLFRLIADEIGLPAWSLYPAAAPGALLMTHDEEGMGDKAAWMAEADAYFGCTSTNFLVPSPALDAAALERYRKAGAEIALHYVMPGPDGENYPGSGYGTRGRFETYGLWKMHPLRRLFSPQEQRQWLDALAPGQLAPITRTHFLAWTMGYDDLFRALDAAGISMDSSYGPDLNDRGYLFGTARPFYPLGPEGLPLNVLELPFISAEDLGGADEAFLGRMLEQSARTTHQAHSVLFHPNAFNWHPSVSNYLAWKGLCARARQLELWVTTFSRLDRFHRSREGSPLRSTTRDATLEVRYTFTGEAGTLAVPAAWRGRRLESVSGTALRKEREMDAAIGKVRLLEVPPGTGTLTLRYGGPAGAAPAERDVTARAP